MLEAMDSRYAFVPHQIYGRLTTKKGLAVGDILSFLAVEIDMDCKQRPHGARRYTSYQHSNNRRPK